MYYGLQGMEQSHIGSLKGKDEKKEKRENLSRWSIAGVPRDFQTCSSTIFSLSLFLPLPELSKKVFRGAWKPST